MPPYEQGKIPASGPQTQPSYCHNGSQKPKYDITQSKSLSKNQRTKSSDDHPNDCLSSNHTTTQVLQLVVDGPLDIVHTIDNFSRDDYADILEVLAEKYPQLLVKLVYLYNENTLLIMAPSSLHKSLSNLSHVFINFVNVISHDQDIYKLLIYMNKHLYYDEQDGENDQRIAIPDFQVDFEVIPSVGKPHMIQKRVDEVTFTSSTFKMCDHLKDIIAMNPTIDLAFLFCIQESPRWQSPSLDDPPAKQLHIKPTVKYNDFNPIVQEGGMEIVWRGITWISIAQVSVEVYMHSPQDGKLVIDIDQQGNYSTHGVLYPSLSTDDVNWLLCKASGALKTSLLALMESGDGEANFLCSLKNAIMQTAYECYIQWHN
ncbi:hypothetical protein HD554DRAFT_2173435 [Boletus coccyginus]|nr:hypothetical protein HD554DRAFT_2173435 [Boletus coccyginus]